MPREPLPWLPAPEVLCGGVCPVEVDPKMEHTTCNITAVIVTYFPDSDQFARLLERLAPQVNHIVVVDNATRPSLLERVDQRTHAEKTFWLRNNANLGLAAAQAQGIAQAIASGADYILLLDQDSLPEGDMVSSLMQASRDLTAEGLSVAGVGPQVIFRETGSPMPFVRFHPWGVEKLHCRAMSAPVRADFLIASGLLAHASVYKTVGMPDASLFIDNIDMEWCFRARQRGHHVYGVRNARLTHQIGTKSLHLPLLKWFGPIHIHSPTRTFFQIRNRILLYRKPYTPWPWIVQDIPRALFKYFFFLAFVKPRLAHFKAMSLAVWDGIRGRSGPHPGATASKPPLRRNPSTLTHFDLPVLTKNDPPGSTE